MTLLFILQGILDVLMIVSLSLIWMYLEQEKKRRRDAVDSSLDYLSWLSQDSNCITVVKGEDDDIDKVIINND